MHTDQLNYISYLTQTSSLNKVAEHFFTSYPVVKKAITDLEIELQVSLIQSSKQGTRLTPAGERVVQFAQTLQEHYAILQDDLKPFTPILEQKLTQLHLYITPSLATEYYLNMYDKFFDTIPNVQVITHASTLLQMLDDSDTTENNIYFTPIYKTNANDQLLQELIKKHHLKSIFFKPIINYVCMHKTSKYTKLNSITLAELETAATVYAFLNTNPLCDGGEEDSPGLQRFSDFSILKRNIKKHQAMGIMKRNEFNYYFGENNSEYVLRPLKGSELYHVAMVSEHTLENNPIIQDFIHFLQDLLQEP